MGKGKRSESRCRYLIREIAAQKGWNIKHPQKGGDFLEEQEIEDFLPNCGLKGSKADFLVCKRGIPLVVVEAKNDRKKIEQAVLESINYADMINSTGKYEIKAAVGVAGEEDYGYVFQTVYWDGEIWKPLSSRGYELTSFPSVFEMDGAILTNNGTTEVSVPAVSDYISTAIDLSAALRSAKIEPSLRPKVLGAVITALYWGEIDLEKGKELDSINQLVSGAILSTEYCAELVEVTAQDKVIDIACGSGGFLVASFDRMMRTAKEMGIPAEIIRESLYGFDTNPTVWSLAALNMFFRGDGKSHIENASCFEEHSRQSVKGKFSKALLNPPFSQKEEPERDFISSAMETLQTMGLLAVVVKSGIFADDDNAQWRNTFLKKHSVLGMISLPGDLFYPTAVDTTIMIAQAHRPQKNTDQVFMAKIWNDGFKKLKGKRVETSGSQLEEVLEAFRLFRAGKQWESSLTAVINAGELMREGAEFSPEQYLPQPDVPEEEQRIYREDVTKSILKTTVCIEDIAEEVLVNFPDYAMLPELPYGEEKTIEQLFYVHGGKSRGESNYLAGTCPYVSSGDPQNSIIRLVDDVYGEVFPNGGITVTCFGQESVQPWRFMARGNGGSAVRILTPKFNMSYSEFVWFAAQINMQKWRFFYGRMAILRRIKKLKLKIPEKKLSDQGVGIADKISELSNKVAEIMRS